MHAIEQYLKQEKVQRQCLKIAKRFVDFKKITRESFKTEKEVELFKKELLKNVMNRLLSPFWQNKLNRKDK